MPKLLETLSQFYLSLFKTLRGIKEKKVRDHAYLALKIIDLHDVLTAFGFPKRLETLSCPNQHTLTRTVVAFSHLYLGTAIKIVGNEGNRRK